MTRLKREADLRYGEPLYYLASVCSSSFFFFGELLPIVPRSSVDFHRPSVIYEVFSTCRFMYRHEKLWPELLNCICFEVRAKRSASWLKTANRRPGYTQRFRWQARHCGKHNMGQLSRERGGGQLLCLPGASAHQFP